MKLTKNQVKEISKYNWEVLENEHGNTAWLSFNYEDGEVFHEIVETLGLDSSSENVKVLVIATVTE